MTSVVLQLLSPRFGSVIKEDSSQFLPLGGVFQRAELSQAGEIETSGENDEHRWHRPGRHAKWNIR